jgi:hypothetical protein
MPLADEAVIFLEFFGINTSGFEDQVRILIEATL